MSTDVLKEILKPVVDEEEETTWPPRNPEALKIMERVIENLYFGSVCVFSLR